MPINNINVGASVKVTYENEYIKAVFPEIRKVLAKGKTGWIISGICGPAEEKPESRLVLVEAGPANTEIEEKTEISKPEENKPKLTFGSPIPSTRKKKKRR